MPRAFILTFLVAKKLDELPNVVAGRSEIALRRITLGFQKYGATWFSNNMNGKSQNTQAILSFNCDTASDHLPSHFSPKLSIQ
jgi:hypothetical protein